TEARLQALTARVDALAQAQERTEARLEALTARVEELAKDLAELARRQARTEDALKSLVDVVTGMNDRVAKVDGYVLERRYRERGHAYFAPIVRRLRFVDGNELAALVDDARQARVLSSFDADSLLQADGVFAGLSHDDGSPVHLLFEASVTVGHHDVRRARERADLLAQVVGTPVFAAVAGEHVPQPVAQAAQDADVWQVVDGRARSPYDTDEPDR
ncbi:MAG: hypothetical protein M3276_02510, partial [Actinomycetota bacterium]|nr:hypothetical protein [Actinomycetota bacterium]